MVQSLARCRDCGLPAKLAERLEWGPDGVILLRCVKPLRLALLDEETAHSLQESLLARFGGETCMKAETQAVRAAVSDILNSLKGRLSRQGAFRKKTLEALEEHSLLLGLGRMELEKYTPGQGGAMLLRRPFVLGMTTSVVIGVLEEMEQLSYTSSLREVSSSDFRLVLEAAEQADAGAQSRGGARGYAVKSGRGGDKGRCSQCGLPTSLAGLLWDELYGGIQAGTGGRRVALLPACILVASAQLEGGSARECEGIVEGAVFRTTKAGLDGGADDTYEDKDVLVAANAADAMREKMTMRGWGKVLAAGLNGVDWRIEVMNAVDDALIAGWLRAIYTIAVGREPRLIVDGEPPLRIFQLSS